MSQYIVAFDTETGGLIPAEADLLTAYFGIFDEEFKLVDELDLKLKPNNGNLPIAQAQALKVNGIDLMAHMSNPETLSYYDGKAKLTSLLSKYREKGKKVSNIKALGYNVPFDVKWVQHHLLQENEWEHYYHYKHIDVMQSVDFLKDCGWFPPHLGSLGTVVEYLQIPKRNAHNAREDTLMTIDVYKKLKEIMKAKKDGGQSQDLISLLESE